MNRPTTALFAALEALLVAAIGIGIPLVPLTVLWAMQYDLQIDWLVFFRVAVDSWLLGHGADLALTIDPAIAAALALPGAGAPFLLTIAPLGFAVVTLLLGMRAGRRLGDTQHRATGLAIAVLAFALLALALVLVAQHPGVRPSIPQGTFLPTLVFGGGVAVGSARGRRLSPGRPTHSAPAAVDAAATRVPVVVRAVDAALRPIRRRIADRPSHERAVVESALAGGAGAALAVVAVASVLVAVLLATGYATVITFYQSLQAGVAGGVVLTLAQLALIPNLVLWAASWLVGPGFAIGSGSSVSPLGTVLGPLPALPVLGPLPQGELSYGLIGVLVPVLAGFLAAIALHPRIARSFRAAVIPWPWLAGAGAGMGLTGGVVLGVLAWWSAGSAGPGRLVDVGPSPLWVGLFAFLEIGLAAAAGMLVAARRRDSTRPR